MSESAAITIRDSWIRPVRLWLSQPWRSNVLVRRSDRYAVLLRIVVALAVVAAVPVAGAIGSATYTAEAARIRAEQATKFMVSATITTSPKWTPARRLEATAQWDENGRAGIAVVGVPRSAAIGKDVPVWLGPDGTATSAPPRVGAAVLTGLGAGVVVLTVAWSGAWLLLHGGGLLLRRYRNTGHVGRPIGKEIE